jgi:hypothetical protein
MSHFCTVVLVDELEALNDREVAEGEVRRLLDPFDENMEVEEYDEQCWCVDREASLRVRDLVRAEFEPRVQLLRGEAEAWVTLEKIRNPAYVAPLMDWPEPFEARSIQLDRDARERAQELMEQQPDRGPDPNCGDCDGTGTVKSNYNPQSKWDWWVIGGRWTGFFEPEDGYDPDGDMRNYGPCTFCVLETDIGKRVAQTLARVLVGGEEIFELPEDPAMQPTGKVKRVGNRWFGTTEDDPDGEPCHVCHGTKIERNFSNAAYPGDVVPVIDWLRNLDKLIPFAVLTPDGQWHEKASMGMFGHTSGDQLPNDWVAEVRQLAEAHVEAVAVAVDLHI